MTTEYAYHGPDMIQMLVTSFIVSWVCNRLPEDQGRKARKPAKGFFARRGWSQAPEWERKP